MEINTSPFLAFAGMMFLIWFGIWGWTSLVLELKRPKGCKPEPVKYFMVIAVSGVAGYLWGQWVWLPSAPTGSIGTFYVWLRIITFGALMVYLFCRVRRIIRS